MANLEDYYVCQNDTDNPDCDLCDLNQGGKCIFFGCPLHFNFYFVKRDNG